MTYEAPTLSIITSIRNQLPMNRLFVEYLQKYTHHTYELIVIDNASDDGSAAFFESVGARMVSNKENYSYPYSQNQGIALARGRILAFLNNDLIVSPNWDKKLVEIMDGQGYDFLSPASNDRAESEEATRKLRRRWRLIKNPLLWLFGPTQANLLRMFRLMYPRWVAYQHWRASTYDQQVREGFSGSCIIVTRQGMEAIGGTWDERIQSADFDLYLRTKKRSLVAKDIKPIHLALGVYFHHYSRLTLKSRHYTPFADAANLMSEDQKWGGEKNELMADIDY
jgi:GT2 family glycosyltransferase